MTDTQRPLPSVHLGKPRAPMTLRPRPTTSGGGIAQGIRVEPRPLPMPSARTVVVGAMLLAGLFCGGSFVGAPYRTADRLRRAFDGGDEKRLSAVVDFAALRSNLKKQLAPALSGVESDDNAARLTVEQLDAAVDQWIRPEVWAHLKDGHLSADAAERVNLAFTRSRDSYENPLRFSVTLILPEVSPDPIRLVMTRSGLTTWKVTRVALPRDNRALMALLTPTPAAPATDAKPSVAFGL